MIRARIFGSDAPFMAWLRRQQEELPSSSSICGIGVTDLDVVIHRYKMVVDSMGTREIQALMQIEVKSRGGGLTDSQRDTYAKHHAIQFRQIELCEQTIRHFGVGVLYMSGTDPDESDEMVWGRFEWPITPEQRIIRKPITKEQLFKLLRFDIHPDNLKDTSPFRRHHLTREIVQVVRAPLGFEYERKVVKRS